MTAAAVDCRGLGASGSWSLSALLHGFVAASVDPDLRVERLTMDSRSTGPGALFLACRGTAGHGLDYAQKAADNGCMAIVAEPDAAWDRPAIERLSTRLGLPVVPLENLSRRAAEIAARFHFEPSRALQVIGITGTNGKTSVSHFIAAALASDQRCGIIGTLGNGFPGELSATGMTTPDPITVQAALADLLKRGAGTVAMEVSSHALDQGRVDAVHFSHAVFTNLSRDHLDYHGDMASYAAAKGRLFRMPGLQWAVINQDDAVGRMLLAALPPTVQRAAFSVEAGAGFASETRLWVRASAIEPLPRGLRIGVQTSLGDGELTVGLIGRFNVANLLAVLAVLLTMGMELTSALKRLAGLHGVPGRMECFGGDSGPLVVVDYAHTPEALEKAIGDLRRHCSGKLCTVFGCGGERDRGKRPLMGEIAERLSDSVIVTDDNPRNEDGDAICAEILAGMHAPEAVLVRRQRALAIRRAIALAGRADAVLVAGKGHETVQDMGALKIRFSDRAQVVQALAEREGQRT
ncbi:UDP-N-acetylmuramoyl-L-alanyl-D-glutamate--2,6-diaminopimelate ligase [Thiohalocapsa marina]|uniref:UDP-N-acetylmuramoyl-L-alanyl-D-glutamate--2, 6-diaminopimelate ligase n=1 Tax=Thiohalocapsa marina TaxID=424902 RepID=UPI0036DDAC48